MDKLLSCTGVSELLGPRINYGIVNQIYDSANFHGKLAVINIGLSIFSEP